MKRREFLGKSAAGIAVAGLGLSGLTSAKAAPQGKLRFSADVPLSEKVDVIVCGGGPAGFAAAVSAARSGARVRLIELQGYLGGTWTAGLMTNFLDSDNKEGLMKEIIEVQKFAGITQSRWLDVEVTKLWLEKLCVEAGVELLYHTRVVDALVEKGRLTAIFTENSNGRQAWPASIFIDTTGNGDLAARSGCGFEMGHPETGLVQPLSLNLLVSGIQLKDLQERKMIAMPGLTWAEPKENLLAEIRKGGADCTYAKPTIFPIRNDFFSLMSNHQYKVNTLDAGEMTKATITARAEVHRQVDALRSLGGMWKDIRIVATADQIGIRESRRIHGLYTVTLDDMTRGARFDDAVCRATFNVDVHALDPAKNKGIDHGFKVKPYDIPLRSLIAKDVKGLMMAGRCISGDFLSHSSYRVSGNAVVMGESAGKVAAKAAKAGKLPQEV
ncbi:MAG: FAD-dependent oxidoreductase [Bacteroidales bacterium]|nr:FAD-dependent oxidoreductase [Bacteroidales bacterium]